MMQINVKMPTIVGILTSISMVNCYNFNISMINCILGNIGHEKLFNLGASFFQFLISSKQNPVVFSSFLTGGILVL